MNPGEITASMAAKEALMALARFSLFGQSARLPLPPCLPLSGKTGQLWCGVAISPHDLIGGIDYFSYHFVDPLMANMAQRIPLGGKYAEMQLPERVMSAANKRYRDFVIRCVIDDVPIPPGSDPRIWRSYKRYYDVVNDEMAWGDCGLIVRFDMMPETGIAQNTASL